MDRGKYTQIERKECYINFRFRLQVKRKLAEFSSLR